MNVARYPLNTAGRDFVCGDLHGSFDILLQALRQAGFDPARDRLFCVGDTVDRGPASERALGFLRTPWVHAVRGNHEDMFLDLYADGEPNPAAIEYMTGNNGMQWWRTLAADRRADFIAEFRKLPIAIEIETARGLVGLVHAEVPAGLTWQGFLEQVEHGDARTIEHALWSRTRVSHADTSSVAGVGRLFCGHTPVDGPRRLGNVFYIDSGAVFGLMDQDPRAGRLTLADIACSTASFSAAPPDLHFDLRVTPSTTPFSAYLTS
ncbi:MAG: metallophosphoesterase [Hyphomicrobiales bacterium]|nr:metallophosphoesterase [Hyphomicrobiales bacterium]